MIVTGADGGGHDLLFISNVLVRKKTNSLLSSSDLLRNVLRDCMSTCTCRLAEFCCQQCLDIKHESYLLGSRATFAGLMTAPFTAIAMADSDHKDLVIMMICNF